MLTGYNDAKIIVAKITHHLSMNSLTKDMVKS